MVYQIRSKFKGKYIYDDKAFKRKSNAYKRKRLYEEEIQDIKYQNPKLYKRYKKRFPLNFEVIKKE